MKSGVAVSVADRDVGAEVVVLLVHGHDGRSDEKPWIVVQHGRGDEIAVGERQEVEPVVDDVELAGALEQG